MTLITSMASFPQAKRSPDKTRFASFLVFHVTAFEGLSFDIPCDKEPFFLS